MTDTPSSADKPAPAGEKPQASPASSSPTSSGGSSSSTSVGGAKAVPKASSAGAVPGGTGDKQSARPPTGAKFDKGAAAGGPGGKFKWLALGILALLVVGALVAGIVALNQRGSQAGKLAESAQGAKASCEASSRADNLGEKRIKVLEVRSAATLAEAAKLKDPRYTQLADATAARARAADQWDEQGLNNGQDVQSACQVLADTNNTNQTTKP